MKLQSSKAPKQQRLKQVATNLYKSDRTGLYYGLIKKGGRQYKESFRTDKLLLARRRLEDFRHKIDRLKSMDAKKLSFSEYNDNGELIGGVAKDWIDFVGTQIEPSTKDRYLGSIKQLHRFFRGLTVAAIDRQKVEKWAECRSAERSIRTFKKDLEALRRIFEYAIDHGLVLDNPTLKIEPRKPHKKVIEIPSRKNFERLLETMRSNRGHRSADLAELLRVSGCRQSEIVGNTKYGKAPMFWRDVDFVRKMFTVTRSKNHEPRYVPIFPAMEKFLHELLARLPSAPDSNDRIIPIRSAKKSIETACRKLGLPKFGHHTCRHVFVTEAIENGVDYKAIAEWVGHQDGGILIGKTYGHLRNEHSVAMAQKMIPQVCIEEPLPNVIQSTVTGVIHDEN